jgi:hypothetical protein
MHRGRLGAAIVLWGVVTLLSGCMSALQSNPGSGVSRPVALPSATAAATAQAGLGSSNTGAPGSFAPDPATAAPTIAPTVAPPASTVPPAASTPSVPVPTLTLPTPAALTNEERWRAQQIDRTPFEGPRPYYTSGSELWWYDPVNQQNVILGRITGDFQGQAEFVLRGQGIAALEVPYQVNLGYGLTALSPVLLDRISAAGYSEWIETYVFLTPNVAPR